MDMYFLWSYRPHPSGGMDWKFERECVQETMHQWREVYEKDEPKVLFMLTKTRRKPKK